jgi:Ca-activated chloride channel family protein
MMVVTPGVDLKPITNGADYTVVLDTSGSMQQKLPVLADGVVKVLGQMQPKDRFRIVTFNTSAQQLIGWTTATPDAVRSACERVKSLRANGSTNLYDGIRLALTDLDADRATSIVLVTDGVTNTGVVDPTQFHKLMTQYDVRVFGFLMGNSANWPLVRTICDATGGFYSGVSNDDDIIGQIMLAKSKITSEAMHDASVKITGVETENVTDRFLGKIYRGQQLVLFGQYDKPGKATFTLKAKLTGEDRTYTTTFDLPEQDTANPEIERLFALNQIELLENKENSGQLASQAAHDAIRNLGLKYQIVTDYTSMLVMSDDLFKENGIARDNQQRVAAERQAQSVRSSQPVQSYRVDQSHPTFSSPAAGLHGSGGGGAIDPRELFIIVLLAGVALLCTRGSGKGATK